MSVSRDFCDGDPSEFTTCFGEEETRRASFLSLAPSLALIWSFRLGDRFDVGAALRGSYAFTTLVDGSLKGEESSAFWLEPNLVVTGYISRQLRAGILVGAYLVDHDALKGPWPFISFSIAWEP